jgi:cytochrome c oxidase cbb3-type subunit III
MSNFWSLWVIILTVISFVLMIWILFGNRKRNETTTEKTTGHSYDGIEELDNPLPAWWFYMFVITIVWGIGYLIAYPGMGNFEGLLNWTQLKEHEQRVSTAEAKYSAVRQAYLEMPVADVASDPAARKMGMRMFGNNCAQCHGSDGKGSYGFPDLTDNDWLYGDSADAIKLSIANGRTAAMPAWGDVIGDNGVTQVTDHLASLAEGSTSAPSAEGAKVYQSYCAACHGAEAKGNPLFGAPNLVDDIWLYGGTRDQITHSIWAGRNGVMPAHSALLGEDKIHLLAAYVYGFRL